MKRPFLIIGPCIHGCDLWAVGVGNTVHWLWHAPKWMSFDRYFTTRRL